MSRLSVLPGTAPVRGVCVWRVCVCVCETEGFQFCRGLLFMGTAPLELQGGTRVTRSVVTLDASHGD